MIEQLHGIDAFYPVRTLKTAGSNRRNGQMRTVEYRIGESCANVLPGLAARASASSCLRIRGAIYLHFAHCR
jgi:hypothetical protein